MQSPGSNQKEVLAALSQAIVRLRTTRQLNGTELNYIQGSRPTPLDHTPSRVVAGTAGTTGGTRSITC